MRLGPERGGGSECLTAHKNAGGMGLAVLTLAADRFAVVTHFNRLGTVIPDMANLHRLCMKDADEKEGKGDDEMKHAFKRTTHHDSRLVPIHEAKNTPT